MRGIAKNWGSSANAGAENTTAPHGRRRLATGGGGRNRTGVHGFAGRCITTLPPRQVTMLDCIRIRRERRDCRHRDGDATPLNTLKKKGSVASLWDWSGRRVSNSRPQPWQGCALPTELLPQGPASYRKADYRATSFNYAALCWQFALSTAYLAAFVCVVSSENEIIAKREPARQQLFARNFIFVFAPRSAHRCARVSGARRASCSRSSTTASAQPPRRSSGCRAAKHPARTACH